MKTLPTIFLLGLFSCGQTTSVDYNVTKDSVHHDNTQKTQLTLVDNRLKTYLDTAFKGWTLPKADRWDTVWYNQYKNDNNLVNYIKNDFSASVRVSRTGTIKKVILHHCSC